MVQFSEDVNTPLRSRWKAAAPSRWHRLGPNDSTYPQLADLLAREARTHHRPLTLKPAHQRRYRDHLRARQQHTS